MAYWSLRVNPRSWQRSALHMWEERLSGVVRVVTGGGKTIFAQMCMLSVRERFSRCRFLIVVPTIALLDQWQVSLVEDLQVPQEQIACFSGEEKPREPGIVNVVVMNTARILLPAMAANYETCLIVDECHRIGSPANALALRGEHVATLGLSATPERDYDDGFERLVAPVLGDVIATYDYVDARRDGVISPFRLVNVRVSLLPDEKAQYDRLSRRIARGLARLRDADEPPDALKRLMQMRAIVSSTAVMRNPVAARLADGHRGERTIIFHERVERANTLLRVLLDRKHSATIYHSGIGPITRRDNLRLYRRGLFDLLVTCRALDEGINVPETRVAIIASSSVSVRQRIQRLGRVLRPAPGKEEAIIYTIYATDHEEKRLLSEASRVEEVASVEWKRGAVGSIG